MFQKAMAKSGNSFHMASSLLNGTDVSNIGGVDALVPDSGPISDSERNLRQPARDLLNRNGRTHFLQLTACYTLPPCCHPPDSRVLSGVKLIPAFIVLSVSLIL